MAQFLRKFLCFIGIHQYDEWKVVDRGNVLKTLTFTTTVVGWYLYQNRQCKQCKFTEHHTSTELI